MILVDSSVWVEFLRSGILELSNALDSGGVLIHPFVVGELACGNIADRRHVLRMLSQLPSARTASHLEVLAFIEGRRLMGRGIGFVDAHLLAATVLSRAGLWTNDRRLAAVARSLGINYER